MMSAAQRSITSLRYDRALSRAVLARSRAHGADPARQLFQVGDVVYYWRGNGTAKREWAAHWHGPATIIGLQHESLWLAHRTTTVKCSKGHVRHATASEQLPLGPMLDTLRAPPVDLDEQPSKRPRDTPSTSTQPSDFDNPDEFVQRARNVSVPLELLSNLCQLSRHLFSPCHMETLHLRHHSCRFLQRHHFNVFQEERQRP